MRLPRPNTYFCTKFTKLIRSQRLSKDVGLLIFGWDVSNINGFVLVQISQKVVLHVNVFQTLVFPLAQSMNTGLIIFVHYNWFFHMYA